MNAIAATITRLLAHLDLATRMALSLIAISMSIYLLMQLSHLAWLFWLVAAVLLWDWVRNNAVWSAFAAFREGNYVRLRRLTGQVRWPRLLSPVSQTYLHWLRGIIEVSDGRYSAAEVYLLLAASGPMKTENDRALLHCLLAEVGIQKGDAEGAQAHLQLAQRLQHAVSVDRMIDALMSRVRTLG